jgi:hypothetical protein
MRRSETEEFHFGKLMQTIQPSIVASTLNEKKKKKKKKK